jgi:hypothetical protein
MQFAGFLFRNLGRKTDGHRSGLMNLVEVQNSELAESAFYT